MRANRNGIVYCLIGFLVIYLTIWHFKYKSSYFIPSVLIESQLDANSSLAESEHSSIFIYRAYYDDRTIKNTIRILAVSKCLGKNTKLGIKIKNVTSALKFIPLEGMCPWNWAENCQWNAYEFQSVKTKRVPKQVEILMEGNRSVVVKVERLKATVAGTLQVCVPPLYWYHDWPRLILFFELWRKHNPTFIIYANSISASVGRVLDYYKDVVQLVHWPMLPMSEDGEDPNTGIYRLSHSLAHNDCLLRMQAEYGALVDVDEYIHLSSKLSLLDYVAPLFDSDKSLGSLMFPHYGLKLGNLDPSFNGIVKAEYFPAYRHPKTVFKPEFVRFLSTHWVRIHEPKTRKKQKIDSTDGMLLHFRQNFDEGKPENSTRLSGIDLKYVQYRAREATKEIFGDEPPPIRSEISTIIERCNGQWRSQGCKVPLLYCRKELQDADDWLFFARNNDSHYEIL